MEDDAVITGCASAAVGDVYAVRVVNDDNEGDEHELNEDRNLLFVIDDNAELGYVTFCVVKNGNNEWRCVHVCAVHEQTAKKHANVQRFMTNLPTNVNNLANTSVATPEIRLFILSSTLEIMKGIMKTKKEL